MTKTRCGMVALIGLPNAGKSTMLNALVGTKLAIVTPKAQTTRSPVRGIRIEGESQLIFIDTPGIYKAEQRFEKAMVASAWAGAADADVVLLLVDPAKASNEAQQELIEKARHLKKPTALVINKVDSISKGELLEATAVMVQDCSFEETFMVSALKQDGLDKLLQWVARRVPEGPHLYPADHLTDAPLRQMAAEITREKLFMRLQQELPYSLTVEPELWQEKPDGSVRINQVIYVQRESHKKIVLGKQGQQLKEIGQSARHEIARLVGSPVHLFLFVKVREDWKETREFYEQIGLEYKPK